LVSAFFLISELRAKELVKGIKIIGIHIVGASAVKVAPLF